MPTATLRVVSASAVTASGPATATIVVTSRPACSLQADHVTLDLLGHGQVGRDRHSRRGQLRDELLRRRARDQEQVEQVEGLLVAGDLRVDVALVEREPAQLP